MRQFFRTTVTPVVLLWDLLFGTYFNAPRPVGEVGVHGPGSYPPLDNLSRQMCFPFERSRRSPEPS